MGLGQIDAMVDFAIAQISGEPEGYRSVVRDLALGWPMAPGLQLVFVLVSAVQAIERVQQAANDVIGNTTETLRMAGLLSSDIYALETLGRQNITGQDLLDYWDRYDPFFLKL